MLAPARARARSNVQACCCCVLDRRGSNPASARARAAGPPLIDLRDRPKIDRSHTPESIAQCPESVQSKKPQTYVNAGRRARALCNRKSPAVRILGGARVVGPGRSRKLAILAPAIGADMMSAVSRGAAQYSPPATRNLCFSETTVIGGVSVFSCTFILSGKGR